MKKNVRLVIIFDSNLIFGLPISKEVRDFIQSTNLDKRLSASYYVPETVLEEAKKKFLDNYKESKQRYFDSTKTLSVILKSKKFPNVSASEVSLERKVGKEFASYGIKIIKTPNDRINWSEIRKSAVFQKLPFSRGETEKGFKDSLVAQTILFSLPSFRSQQVAIICRDGLLSTFLKEKTKARKNVALHPSLPDFQSVLRLQLLGDRLIKEISNEAKLAFYNPQDALLLPNERQSIFYREDFPRQILVKFPSLFANPNIRQNSYGLTTWFPQTRVNWVPVEEPTFGVANPVFISKSRDRNYLWQSTVVYRQRFEHTASSTGLYSGFNNKGELKLEFLIKWTSPVDDKGKIDPTKCTIKDISPQFNEKEGFVTIAAADIPVNEVTPLPSFDITSGVPTMISGPTLAGQGTVPVVPVSSAVFGRIEITEPILGIGNLPNTQDEDSKD